MKLWQNFIQQQMFLTEPPKFKLIDKPSTAPSQNIFQQIQRLEFRVNFDSPRTIKAMDNKGFTKDMLIRRHIVEFKRKDEDDQQQQARYQKHLYELKDNLITVLQERANIKRQLRERQEDGATPPSRKQYIDPIPNRDLQSKLQKEREKDILIRDTATKEEIVIELKRRQTYENWKKKIEQIELGKTKVIDSKVKMIHKQNEQAEERSKQQREKYQEHLNINFKLSQSFSDKFITRAQQVREIKFKKIEKLRSKAKKSVEAVQINKEKIDKDLNKQDDYRLKKDLEHELRLQMEKENLKMRILMQQQKLEQKQSKAAGNYQSQIQGKDQEKLDNIHTKFEKTEINLKKKEEAISNLLKQHKKDMAQRFEKQKQLEEKELEQQEYVGIIF